MQLAIPPRVTDRAFARLPRSAPRRALRVAVEGGGCSGFQYDIKLDDAAADDLVLEKDGARVLIDPVSLPFLADAEIDFADELIGARFVVNNPNATSSCGCGTSLLDLTPGRALPTCPARAAPAPPPGGRFSPAGSGAALRVRDRRRHRGAPFWRRAARTRAAPRGWPHPRRRRASRAADRKRPPPTLPPGLQPGQRPPRPGGRFSPAGSGAALRVRDRRRYRGARFWRRAARHAAPPSGRPHAPRRRRAPRERRTGKRPPRPSRPGFSPSSARPAPRRGASRPPGRAPPSAPGTGAATGGAPFWRRTARHARRPRANLTPRGAGDRLARGRPEAPSPTVPPGLPPGQRPPRPQAGASRPPGRAPPSAPRSSAATGRPPIPRRWTQRSAAGLA